MDFTYTARTKEGTVERDILVAPNEKAALDALRAKGVLPVSISNAHKRTDINGMLEGMSKIKLIDKITLFKNLGVMIKAGLPIARALKILAVQTQNPRLRKIVSEISRGIESGSSFSDALSKYPKVFPAVSVSMVRAGEASGNLEQNLHYLSDQMQRDYELISKARGAMIYPIVVLVALLLVGFVMFTFILPKLTATFQEFDVDLPMMTKVVIAVVNVFAQYGIFVFLSWVVLAGLFLYWRKTRPGQVVIHKLVLYFPVFGDIVKKINIARFLRVFVSLIKSGMPVVESLDVSSQVVGNIYYQQVIRDAGAKVKIGMPLVTSFKKNDQLFPSLVVEMMEVGEESGTTDVVLEEIATFYETEVAQTMTNLSSVLEPMLMVVIGSIVGVLAVALITPIYSISQSI